MNGFHYEAKSGENAYLTDERPVYTIGIALLLVAFIAVCLIILSSGAYVMSKEDFDQARAGADRQTEYVSAVNKAEELCSQLDRKEAEPVSSGDSGGETASPSGTNDAVWNAADSVITVEISGGGTLEAGVSETGGIHRIAWTKVIPNGSRTDEFQEQTLAGM